MSRVVELANEARLELLDAINWYGDRSSGLGKEILSAVTEALERLEPCEQWPVIEERAGRTVRKAVVRRFPYRIVFVDLGSVLRVLAVAHTSRAPKYWRDRG